MTPFDDDPDTNSPEDLGYRRPPEPVVPRPQQGRKSTTMATTQPDDDDATEGPRGFGPLLQQLEDGDVHAELSRELQALGRVCRDHALRYQRAAKGELILKLKLCAQGYAVQITSDVTKKEPKKPREQTTLFLTPGGNLSVENPRQQKLPLREVPQSTTKTKDISTEAAPVRGV